MYTLRCRTNEYQHTYAMMQFRTPYFIRKQLIVEGLVAGLSLWKAAPFAWAAAGGKTEEAFFLSVGF